VFLLGVTIIIFAKKTIKMARKGDIDSKTVASRVPMETYISLLRMSSKEKTTISSYVAELLNECVAFGRPVHRPPDPTQIGNSEYKNLYERLKIDYANETFKTKELSDKIRVLEEELSKFKRF
jgi:hypothetical protein